VSPKAPRFAPYMQKNPLKIAKNQKTIPLCKHSGTLYELKGRIRTMETFI